MADILSPQARELAARRRAKRGFVASYIHELSARHADDARARRAAAERATSAPLSPRTSAAPAPARP
jgi:hypothetical protein